MERQPTPQTPENLIYGRNPVREALKSGRDIEKILMAKGEITGSLKEILGKARARGVVVQEVDRIHLDRLAQGHQGVCAYVSAASYCTIDDIFQEARSRGEPPFLVLLDGITDPQNVGAIARSAECAGAHGLVLCQRRAAGLTPAAVKTAAGALEFLKVAKVVNMARTVKELQEKGVWVFAADAVGEDYAKVDFSGPIALVVGDEGEGVSRLVLETCDRVVSLPLLGRIASLNASCAAAVLLYEVVRARRG